MKMCKCANGVPESGITCSAHGDKKCKSCKNGYYINGEETECMRTYMHAESTKICFLQSSAIVLRAIFT